MTGIIITIVFAASHDNTIQSVIGTAVRIISFGLLILLTEGKNLGRKRSLLYAGLNMGLNIAFFLLTIIFNVFPSHSSELPLLSIFNAVSTVLSLLTYILITAKYEDKKARGTE